MEKTCDGLNPLCQWANHSTFCMSCIRYENFSKDGRHWGAIKDWFITHEEHAIEVKHSMELMSRMAKYSGQELSTLSHTQHNHILSK